MSTFDMRSIHGCDEWRNNAILTSDKIKPTRKDDQGGPGNASYSKNWSGQEEFFHTFREIGRDHVETRHQQQGPDELGTRHTIARLRRVPDTSRCVRRGHRSCDQKRLPTCRFGDGVSLSKRALFRHGLFFLENWYQAIRDLHTGLNVYSADLPSVVQVYRNEEPSAKGMLKSGVPREQLFFTSKVPPRSINYQDAKKCVDESLRKTGLTYIDLYLLHAPYGGKEGRLGAWKALVESVAEGKVRSIGVSNVSTLIDEGALEATSITCASESFLHHLRFDPSADFVPAVRCAPPRRARAVAKVPIERKRRRLERQSSRTPSMACASRHSAVVRAARRRPRSLQPTRSQHPRQRPLAPTSGEEVLEVTRADPASMGAAKGLRDFAQERHARPHRREPQHLRLRAEQGGHGRSAHQGLHALRLGPDQSFPE